MKNLVQTCIVAGVVIKQHNKYLLVQENRPSTDIHEKWNFPAGRVEEGDTIEDTAIKEAREEAGYEVKLIRRLGIFQESASVPPKHAFEAKIISGELKWPEDEILAAKWLTLDEIKNIKEKLRSEWILGAINILERGR